LRAARAHGLVPHLLGLRNSADAAGEAGVDRSRVVGYGAIAFEPAACGAASAAPAGAKAADAAAAAEATDATDATDATLGRALVAIARLSISRALGLPTAPGKTVDAALVDLPALHQPGATFVTLHDAEGRLRGCVGQLEATRALGDDVSANALEAAFGDHRFEPVSAAEWPGLAIEVSLLGPAEPMAVANQADALARLRPGIDGVILAWHGRRATFLPQVWAQLPDVADFLAALKVKAGLAADFWTADLRLLTYQVRSFDEAAPIRSAA
jgi:AmmeMemoRadiSam system protein A